mgnify:CR=1 FL=1
MNKLDLINAIANEVNISKAAAARSLDAVLSAIAKGLKSGAEITLVGFGKFKVNSRAARKGRNPQTGADIMIKASKVPAFKAGKALKDAVQKGGKK